MEDVKTINALEPRSQCCFVGEALGLLRQEVGNNAAVLGFVGALFTLASYIVEGGTSTHYKVIKKMAFDAPMYITHSFPPWPTPCRRVCQISGG